MAQEQSAIRERQNTNLKEPRRYKVTMFNDDFTPMDFVVMVLTSIFNKNQTDAEQIMLDIHHKGKAVVGIYSLDIAQTKVEKTTKLARQSNYPLKVIYAPEN